MLRGVAGTPMRRIDFAKSWLALAEPEPLTLANRTTKSLTQLHGPSREHRFAGTGCDCLARAMGQNEMNCCMSHAPVGQRSAQRPQCRHTSSSFAMIRPVFSPCETYRSCVRFVGRGVQMRRRRLVLLAILGEGDAVGRADIHTGVAFDAQLRREHGLHVAVQAALRFLEAQASRSKPSSTSALMSDSAICHFPRHAAP